MVLCKKNKSQASIEYLVILGIALFLLMPLISMFESSKSESEFLASSNQIIMSGRLISSVVKDVYYQGAGTRLLIEFNFPENVFLKINNFTTVDGDYLSELVYSTNFNNLDSDFLFLTDSNLFFTNSSTPCNISLASRNISSLDFEGQLSLFVESCGKGNVVIYSNEY